jgi:GTP-binding protein
MRREGYELCCSNPRVLFKEIDGVKCEPMERVVLDVPMEYVGPVVEKLGQRKGDLLEMNPVGDRTRIEYLVPSRCLIGYRSEFLTATHGEGIINTIFDSYQPHRGEIPMRFTGALVASCDGETTRYGLFHTQERGNLFVGPQTKVYEGMIVGMNPKNDDIAVNPCAEKKLTAIRSSGADEKLLLTPPVIFSLEEAIEFITDDELIEVTPKSIRLRKKILNTELRMKETMRIRRAMQANK